MNAPRDTGTRTADVGRLFRALRFSWQGLKSTWASEAAFRQEVIALAVLFPAALWLGDNGIERALLAGSLILVLIVELLNSGVEALVDHVSKEHHPLLGMAKDVGSAAVLLALLNVALVWILILI